MKRVILALALVCSTNGLAENIYLSAGNSATIGADTVYCSAGTAGVINLQSGTYGSDSYTLGVAVGERGVMLSGDGASAGQYASDGFGKFVLTINPAQWFTITSTSSLNLHYSNGAERPWTLRSGSGGGVGAIQLLPGAYSSDSYTVVVAVGDRGVMLSGDGSSAGQYASNGFGDFLLTSNQGQWLSATSGRSFRLHYSNGVERDWSLR